MTVLSGEHCSSEQHPGWPLGHGGWAKPMSSLSAQAPRTADLNAFIKDAAQGLAEYQRLTAEGKRGEARQKTSGSEAQARGTESLSTVTPLVSISPAGLSLR